MTHSKNHDHNLKPLPIRYSSFLCFKLFVEIFTYLIESSFLFDFAKHTFAIGETSFVVAVVSDLVKYADPPHCFAWFVENTFCIFSDFVDARAYIGILIVCHQTEDTELLFLVASSFFENWGGSTRVIIIYRAFPPKNLVRVRVIHFTSQKSLGVHIDGQT